MSLRQTIEERVATWAFRHCGPLSRAVLFRGASGLPWHRSLLDVTLHELDIGVGDALMCTPVLRELKRVNPRCHVRFYTRFPSLLQGLPYIDEVRPFEERPPDAIVVGYCGSDYPPRRTLVSMLGDRLGLAVRDHVPDCIIDRALVDGWRHAWRSLPRPHIVVNRFGNAWTPNKDWPGEYWDALIAALVRECTVIEIGKRPSEPQRVESGNYVDLRGATSLEQFVAAVAAADIHVGPISGPVHVAAAARVPSVVIYGGFEHPTDTAYPGNVNFYTPLHCAPCWLVTPCPYDKQCLREIHPPAVHRAIRTLWASIQ
jgi:ADP-heptose:LPS heptosyltransferase